MTNRTMSFPRFFLLGLMLPQLPALTQAQLIVPQESDRYIQIGVGVTDVGTCTGEGYAFERSQDFAPFAESRAVSRACEYGQATGSASQISRIGENSIFMRATL